MDGPMMSNECCGQIGPAGVVAICGVQHARTVHAVLGRKGYRGRVYCVEAAPEASDRLRHELADYGKVKVIHAALCASDAKSVTFHLNKSAVSSSLVCRKDTIKSVPVPVLRLRGLLAQTGPLDCLVMDIEGAEYGVLMNMNVEDAARIKSLCVELHPNLWPVPTGTNALLTHLAQLGYALHMSSTGHRPEVSAIPEGKRDTGWQRYHDPTHPCCQALRERFGWVAGHALPPSFLDIGCSNGVGLLVVSQVLGMQRLVGVDASLASVVEARGYLHGAGVNAEVVAGMAETLPYADGSFSSAFLGEVLEHVNDAEKALAEAVRVVAQGGSIIITVPLGGHTTPEHRRIFSETNLRAMCEASGIDIMECVTIPSGCNTPWLCVAGRNTRGK